MRTRAEHVAWCKERALKYLDKADLSEAVTSMLSDLGKHEETRGLTEGVLGMLGMQVILRQDRAEARRFITGFAE